MTDFFHTLQVAREKAGTTVAAPGCSALAHERVGDLAPLTPLWRDRAYAALLAMLADKSMRSGFTAEQLREFAGSVGVPEPTDPRAWGMVVRRAEKDGLIVKRDQPVRGSRVCHGRKQTVWAACV